MKRRSTQTAPARMSAPGQTYQAGCKRTWTLASSEPDLAYTALEFPECPECPHRVEPDGGPSFCTLRPLGAPNPFAALQALELSE